MIKRFNDWLADKLAYWLSTMTCFYIVAFGTLSTLYFDTPKGVQGWLLFWISIFFQAVALPVLGYVGRKSGEQQEKVINETHDAVLMELSLIKEQLKIAQEEREAIREQLELAKLDRDLIMKLISSIDALQNPCH